MKIRYREIELLLLAPATRLEALADRARKGWALKNDPHAQAWVQMLTPYALKGDGESVIARVLEHQPMAPADEKAGESFQCVKDNWKELIEAVPRSADPASSAFLAVLVVLTDIALFRREMRRRNP